MVPNGGAAHLHAVGAGGAKRSCGAGKGSKTLHASAMDSALLSVGRETPFPTPLAPLSAVEARGGLTVVLHNNIWDVNCAYWTKVAALSRNFMMCAGPALVVCESEFLLSVTVVVYACVAADPMWYPYDKWTTVDGKHTLASQAIRRGLWSFYAAASSTC